MYKHVKFLCIKWNQSLLLCFWEYSWLTNKMNNLGFFPLRLYDHSYLPHECSKKYCVVIEVIILGS